MPQPDRPAINPGFVLDARNKKSLALDLRSEAGREVLYRLVRGADVFITNYPPPVRHRLKITYDDLAPLNDRLIYASFTGYGETGPRPTSPASTRRRGGRATGLMHLVRAGEEATPRARCRAWGTTVVDGHVRRYRHRLYQREKTGKGNYVSSSLLANGLWANGCSVQAALCGDVVRPQPARETAPNALRTHYQCRDGRWLLLSIASDEWRWDKFKACLGDPALEDRRFATVESREQHSRALLDELDRIFASRDLAHWRRVLDDAGIIFGIVAETQDIADDEQALAAGHLVQFTDAGYMTVTSPIEIRGQEKVPPRHAPRSASTASRCCATPATATPISRKCGKRG